MTATTCTDVFADFRADWHAAMNPCLDCALARCPEPERAAFLVLIDDFLMTAPSPPYSPVQQRRQRELFQPILDRVNADPDAQAALRAAEDQMHATFRDLPTWKKWRNRLLLRGFELRHGLRGPMRYVNRVRAAPWD